MGKEYRVKVSAVGSSREYRIGTSSGAAEAAKQGVKAFLAGREIDERVGLTVTVEVKAAPRIEEMGASEDRPF